MHWKHAISAEARSAAREVDSHLAELVTESLEVMRDLSPGNAEGLDAGSPAAPRVDLPLMPVVLRQRPAAKLGCKASLMGLHGCHQGPQQICWGSMGIKAC